MALDASKNNRVLETRTSVMYYSDLYDIGEPLTEEQLTKYIAFENFLVREFLKSSKNSQSKKIKQFENEFKSNIDIDRIEEKKETYKEIYPLIYKKPRYKLERIEPYDSGLVVFYYDEDKKIKSYLDIKHKDYPELENILNLKDKNLPLKLENILSSDKNIGKSLKHKLEITIELLKQK